MTHDLPPANGKNLSNDLLNTEIDNDLTKMAESLAQMEDNLSKLEKNVAGLENLDDDLDEEDICLSKLKATIDIDNTISEPKDPILQELQEIASSPLHETDKMNDDDGNAQPSSSASDGNLQIEEKEQNIDDVQMEECQENKDNSEKKLEADENKKILTFLPLLIM